MTNEPPSLTMNNPTDVRDRIAAAIHDSTDPHSGYCDPWKAADNVIGILGERAALERLEALEAALEDTTRHLGLYVQDDGHETNGPEGWVNDADPAAWDAFRRASALLATPAPAPQGGEG